MKVLIALIWIMILKLNSDWLNDYFKFSVSSWTVPFVNHGRHQLFLPSVYCYSTNGNGIAFAIACFVIWPASW